MIEVGNQRTKKLKEVDLTMMRSMFAGVTGLRNHQIRMDAIGNNIANVNTVGYKASRVNFQDSLNQMMSGATAPKSDGTRGGINALQVGLGMNVASIDIVQTQGSLQNTGNVTDLAIQGDGFFILTDGSRDYYTRAGNFQFERDGRLVNPSNGLEVRGWMADVQGNVSTNTPIGTIQIPVGQSIAPIATTKLGLGGNLDSDINSDTSYPPLTVTDINGNPCTVEIELTPIGFNQFQYNAKLTNGTVVGPGGTGIITLDTNGDVISTSVPSFVVKPDGPTGTNTTITLPIPGQPLAGSFISPKAVLKSLSMTGFGATAPAPFNLTVPLKDALGNPIDLDYTITFAAGTTYNYTVAPNNPLLANVVAGMAGSFDWTPAGGLTNVVGVPCVVQSLVPTPQLLTAIAPPTQRVGDPVFQVVSEEGFTDGKFKMAESLVTTTTVYDSLGKNHTLTTTLTKTATNNWDWACTDQAGIAVGNGHLIYSSSGKLISSVGTNITFTPTGALPVSITPDFSKVTQFSGGVVKYNDPTYDPTKSRTEVTSPEQDGYPRGELQGYNIDKSGVINGIFSNGMQRALAQVGMANFTNPGGLIRAGDTIFQESSNSGTAQVGTALRNGRGIVMPGTQEMSNVDLSQEFTEMIITERGYQSNSRVITTSDEMLQEVVNLKR
jgi:flagellar hook protein FlgE